MVLEPLFKPNTIAVNLKSKVMVGNVGTLMATLKAVMVKNAMNFM